MFYNRITFYNNPMRITHLLRSLSLSRSLSRSLSLSLSRSRSRSLSSSHSLCLSSSLSLSSRRFMRIRSCFSTTAFWQTDRNRQTDMLDFPGWQVKHHFHVMLKIKRVFSCLTDPMVTAACSCPHSQFLKLLPDLDEAQVQFPAKVVGEAAVVVVEAEVGGAHLTHPQLLLLETGGWHGVPVYVLNTHTIIPITVL